MKLLKPVEIVEMRAGLFNGIGAALGFLLLYLVLEKINPKYSYRLPGGPNSPNG